MPTEWKPASMSFEAFFILLQTFALMVYWMARLILRWMGL